MLAALLALVVHASGAAEVAKEEERNDLYVLVAAIGGASLVDVDPNVAGGGLRGPVFGVRAGFRATRPPVSEGRGRIGVMPMLALRYEPLSGRTEWFADAAITVTLWTRFVVASALGYGMSSVKGGSPHPFLAVNANLLLTIGALWVGLNLEAALRFPGRTLQVGLVAGWQLELLDF